MSSTPIRVENTYGKMDSSVRTIVVGDVHGCLDELQLLLKSCNFDSVHDRLIFVGDLVNKGPKSFEVLRFIRDSEFECVTGNHELKLIQCMEKSGSFKRSDLKNLAEDLLEDSFDWLSWLKSLPGYIEDPDFLVVHAGLAPSMTLENTPLSILANIRTWDGNGENMNRSSDPAWYDLYLEEKLVIYGHWAVDGLKVRRNTIGLDSGCCYGRKLSAVILPERRIVQVESKYRV